jgi:hypothetical protein
VAILISANYWSADVDIINSGKHLLGEKPFGIDKVMR